MTEERDIKPQDLDETVKEMERSQDGSEEKGNTAEESKEGSCQTKENGGAASEPETDEEEKPVPDEKDIRIAELDDKYRRLFAEFDNFRKRNEAEKAIRFSEGEKSVLLMVLPLIDNFERALASVPDDAEASAFAVGIDKIYKSFMDALKELGVTPIEAVGKEFDANLHNAVMHVEDENEPENTVTEELQKGYLFRDKVLRYSMVKVAN